VSHCVSKVQLDLFTKLFIKTNIYKREGKEEKKGYVLKDKNLLPRGWIQKEKNDYKNKAYVLADCVHITTYYCKKT